jgi:hypothetical protein
MKKVPQIPREPRRKLWSPDRNKRQEIRRLFEESEERVRRFLEQFDTERTLSSDQDARRRR